MQKKKRVVGEGVFNLSGKTLLTEEIAFFLDNGLKHAPMKNLNKFDTYIGIQKYIRKINIKKYILSNSMNSVQNSMLRYNSLYNPQVNDNHFIDVFKKLVSQDLDSLKVKKVSYPIHIKKGIQLLTNRKNIVIRPADKGGGVVIQSKNNTRKKSRDSYKMSLLT